jgi:hypothetical protein
MRGMTLAMLLALAGGQAHAQAIQSSPLAPPPGTAAPLGAVPSPQGAPQAATPDTPAAPAAPGAPSATPAPPAEGDWVPQNGFVLRALDKVTARASTITGKVGETVKFGSLAIVVRRCVVRPPDHEPGAAAFLDITDTAPGADPATAFHGWMFSNYPAVAMLQHPTADIRVSGCRP